MRDLHLIRTYIRGDRKIQLTSTQRMAIIGILTGFYITAIVNVISWDKAYAVFARDTFIDRKSYMLKPIDEYFERLMYKYTRLGWRMEEIMRSEHHPDKAEFNTSVVLVIIIHGLCLFLRRAWSSILLPISYWNHLSLCYAQGGCSRPRLYSAITSRRTSSSIYAYPNASLQPVVTCGRCS